MKKISIIKSLLMVTLGVMTFVASANDIVKPYSEAPAKVKEYVSTHFPNAKVLQYQIDFEGALKKHEVLFSDGTKLEFNYKHNVVEIDGKSKLPDSVIPGKILNYVKENFPDNHITDWEIDGKFQQVKLDNGLDLEFTMKGKFVRIDD